MSGARTYRSRGLSALHWLALLALLALGACQDMDPTPGNDGGAGNTDAGASTTDAAPSIDAPSPLSDAIGPPDANPCNYDAGVADGGIYDGGPSDAGPCDFDAGMPISDAGPPDA